MHPRSNRDKRNDARPRDLRERRPSHDGFDRRADGGGTTRFRRRCTRGITYPVDSALQIGRHANRLIRFFDGVIDEVTIHSRALSGPEIATLAARRGG